MKLILPRLISDGMILQRDQEIHLWGWSEPGTAVRVLLDGAEAAVCITKESGRFDLKLPGRPADGGPAGHEIQFIAGDAG